MTVRVTTLKGADAGAYYVDALPTTTSNQVSRVASGSATWLDGLVSPAAWTTTPSLPLWPGRTHGDRTASRPPYNETSVRGFDVNLLVLTTASSPPVASQ